VRDSRGQFPIVLASPGAGHLEIKVNIPFIQPLEVTTFPFAHI
jgi:hypothetical protein